MHVRNSTFIVVIVAALLVTVFSGEKAKCANQQSGRINDNRRYEDKSDRYPTAEYDEPEPSDPVKRAALRKQKRRYDKDAPFTNPGPGDEAIEFRPEWQFDFPAFPVAKSDAVVIGQVLLAKAHRSENKMNVFSNFEIRVDEVLKGSSLTAGNIITVERIGGCLIYPNGRRVLFRLSGNGMPAVGARYAFFLTGVDEGYSILTGYELAAEGIVPLDNADQFRVHQGEQEISFLKALRDAVSQVPQEQ